jgi:hypothetical protein
MSRANTSEFTGLAAGAVQSHHGADFKRMETFRA